MNGKPLDPIARLTMVALGVSNMRAGTSASGYRTSTRSKVPQQLILDA